jgi:hypothetical protein
MDHWTCLVYQGDGRTTGLVWSTKETAAPLEHYIIVSASDYKALTSINDLATK